MNWLPKPVPQEGRHENAGCHGNDDGIVQAAHIELAAQQSHHHEQHPGHYRGAEDDERAVGVQRADGGMGHGKPARDAHHDGEDRHGHEQPHEEPSQGNRALGRPPVALIRPFGISQRGDHGQNGRRAVNTMPTGSGSPTAMNRSWAANTKDAAVYMAPSRAGAFE